MNSILILIATEQILTISCGNIQGRAVNNTLTLGYTIPWEQEWIIGPRMGSAIVVGLDEVERRQLLPGYKIEWTWRDSYCQPSRGMQVTVDIWNSVEDLDAIIGDGCSVVCESAALLAAAWGIPVVSWACTNPVLSDKSVYPTFTRIKGSWLNLAPVFDRLADEFEWHKVAILTTPEDLFRLTATEMKRIMEDNGKEIIFHVVESTVRGDNVDERSIEHLREVYQKLKEQVYIYFILSHPNDIRNMLVVASEEGMLNGKYAFATSEINIIVDIPSSYKPEVSREIFDGLLGVGVKKITNPDFDAFAEKVIKAFNHSAFANVPHLPLTASVDEVDVHAGFVHDAVLEWAYGVNKTLEQGFAPDDGFKVAENIFNSTFQGITGRAIINEVGDRILDKRVVIVQKNKMVLLMDWLAEGSGLSKVYLPDKPDDWSGIYWPGNATEVPRDSPVCGWKGELCLAEVDYRTLDITTATVVCGALVAGFTIGIVIGFRRFKSESESQHIRLVLFKWTDLVFVPNDLEGSESDVKLAPSSNYVANLKGELVFVKQLGNSPINVQDRHILADLKQMRDVSHENLNRFVGVCVEPYHSYILMAYESRGSVQDILKNKGLKLNWDIKISLIIDISSGLWYIHSTTMGCHGHLTSAKCVVDKRWTCKITGHGLQHIRKQAGLARRQSSSAESLLWTSPELLRDPEAQATKMSDVFSLAIIMQEVILGTGPYDMESPAEAAGIISMVKQGGAPPYRPQIPRNACSGEWLALVEKCWEDNAFERPTIGDILVSLQEINMGKSLNLIDSMVNRLESHTRHLEDVIIERTSDLLAEKNKVEYVLSELFPPSVARKLIKGDLVVPETFASITIFLSDIVGFTQISTKATPMQIVLLLNDMYTMFDAVSRQFDVYKVATIGDAYMVASGVPVRNGSQHAAEICNFALAIRDSVTNFPIPHMPGNYMQLRIGIHSGPCVAGVTGVKVPRYLLFGETVDLVAKLESGGKPMKIHISDATESIIREEEQFTVEGREDMPEVGQHILRTFWLNGVTRS